MLFLQRLSQPDCKSHDVPGAKTLTLEIFKQLKTVLEQGKHKI